MRLFIFTLIELLVVIAIIAILAAVLMPALSSAKEQSRKISCMNNMKQTGIGISSYASEYNDWMPIANDTSNHSYEWKYEIAVCLGMDVQSRSRLSEKIFRCPSAPPQVLIDAYGGGYGWNASLANLAPANNGFGYMENSSSRGRVRFSTVNNPSQTAVAGDGTDWGSMSGDMSGTYYIFPPSAAADSSKPSPPVGNRHRGGINIIWADGHVECKSQSLLMCGENGDIDWYYKRIK